MSDDICKNSTDAESYWREEAKGIGPHQSAWVISLDAERHFLGCDQITWRFYGQPILLAHEVLTAAKKRNAAEFIFVYHRPGFAPNSDLGSKERARAIILAARQEDCNCLDYMIVGEQNEKYLRGIFSLCHHKTFHAANPFPPRTAMKAPQGRAYTK